MLTLPDRVDSDTVSSLVIELMQDLVTICRHAALMRVQATTGPAVEIKERPSMRIGELAERANESTSAVRYYEKVGLLPAPRRVSGRREYSDDALARLAIVLHARNLGFSIAETSRLVSVFPPSTPSARWKTLATAKLVEVDAIIAHAKAMRTTLELISTCRCETWDECGRALMRRTTKTRS
jgi:MerR family redox-sensitive transcriptional activator SoxR